MLHDQPASEVAPPCRSSVYSPVKKPMDCTFFKFQKCGKNTKQMS